jgi:hypothetical protein
MCECGRGGENRGIPDAAEDPKCIPEERSKKMVLVGVPCSDM